MAQQSKQTTEQPTHGGMSVFAVSVESESSGAVDWYHTRVPADLAFEERKTRFADCPGELITLFEKSVPAGISKDEITKLVDSAMHEQDYIVLNRHVTGQKSAPENLIFRVLGAHPNRKFFDIKVEAIDGQRAFGVAALMLEEAGEEGDAEFYAAIPETAAFVVPGESVVTLETVLNPEQADVFGVNVALAE